MTKKQFISKKEVKNCLGASFDDEGLITLDIDNINEIIEYYLCYSD